jgi:hypothetical protein
MLRRLLANGPLTALPTRAADEELLLRMAARRFEPRRDYSEAQVNEVLRAWLQTFTAPFGIDHVTLRRRLVDTRLLLRDTAGANYWVMKRGDAAFDIDPAQVLAQMRREREARKRAHQPGGISKGD